MDASLFRQFASIAYDKAGIRLRPGKEALVSARVAKRIRALGLAGEREYVEYLQKEDGGEELVKFLDVISTNFTSFYREPDHFEVLEAVVQRRLDEGSRRFRIWSAASSSGEEPYSIALTMFEKLKGEQADFKILATDISTRVLDEARSGIYPAARLGPVPRWVRERYFRKHRDERDPELDRYELVEDVKNHVVFNRLNLSKPPFPMKGPLDMVFCRNVLIYFDDKVRQGLISEIERLLRPGGTLVIGHTETLTGIDCRFRLIRPSVFQLPEAA